MTAIDKIRAALEQARQLIPEYCGVRTQYDDAFASLAELETELVELRAFKAAIDAAPTVATVIDIGDECGENLNVTFYSYKLPPVGTELITRPEAK
jgi:hypothetical protein